MEFAVVAQLFLLVFIGSLEIARFGYTALSLQYTVNTALRWGITGQTSGSLDRTASIQQKVAELGNNFGLHLNGSEMKICSGIPVASCESNSAGGPNELLSITAQKTFKFPLITTGFQIGATASGRNEPYG